LFSLLLDDDSKRKKQFHPPARKIGKKGCRLTKKDALIFSAAGAGEGRGKALTPRTAEEKE